MRFPLVTGLSIRLKIMLLIACSLLLSGTATIWIGTRLISRDKTSYIYDFSASQVDRLASQLNMAVLPLDHLIHQTHFLNRTSLDTFAKALGLHVLTQPEVPFAFEPGQEFHFASTRNSRGFEIWLKSEEGQMLGFENKMNETDALVPHEFSLCMVAVRTHQVLYRLERPEFTAFTHCEETTATFNSDFQMGAKEITARGHSYIASYRYLIDHQLLVMSLVPTEVAFSSAKQLAQRATVLGFTLLFFTLGIAILLVRTIVRRIQELTTATQEIAKGNFKIDLSSVAQSQDEISSLAHAFNTMSEKIQKLLYETAAKARMEKELETAHLVQKQFFPTQTFSEEGLMIEGLSRSASECGGDFWQFKKIGSRVIFIFGDITGHGVPAALLTAAVHGVFTSFTHRMEKDAENKVDHSRSADEILFDLAESLDSSVRSIAKGEAGFPCILGLFDLSSLKFQFMNFGHPPPLAYHHEEQRWTSLMAKLSNPLGTMPLQLTTPKEVDLANGVNLVFYTDGLFDQRLTDQKSLNKKTTLDFLSTCVQNDAASSSTLVSRLLEHAIAFFGSEPNALPDDITLVNILYLHS